MTTTFISGCGFTLLDDSDFDKFGNSFSDYDNCEDCVLDQHEIKEVFADFCKDFSEDQTGEYPTRE